MRRNARLDRQNLHVHVEASGEQYRFVMPGATLTADEFRRLEEKVLAIESGAILVISSLPPGIDVTKLTQLRPRNNKGSAALSTVRVMPSAALEIGNIELVKPNQKELSALVGRELTQPDDVQNAAKEIVRQGKARRVVVSSATGRAGR
jgi:6-phosphofructokinase 2